MATKPAHITVFVHIHHVDVWQEMCPVLAQRLDVPFTLVMTGAEPDTWGPLPQTPLLQQAQPVRAENRGRDILPFLRTLAAQPDCGIGLKLHTKKSPQRSDGALWRNALLDGLLPKDGVADIVSRIAADSRIGIVTPEDFALSIRRWSRVNEPAMVELMATLGVELTEDLLEDAFFPAGSMFWFRRAAIETLLADPVMALFEPEEGQLDGTIAHAVERLFAVEARRQGFVSLALPALLACNPSTGLTEMLAMARRYADVPTQFFQPPGTPASTALRAKPPGSGLATRLLRRLRPA